MRMAAAEATVPAAVREAAEKIEQRSTRRISIKSRQEGPERPLCLLFQTYRIGAMLPHYADKPAGGQ